MVGEGKPVTEAQYEVGSSVDDYTPDVVMVMYGAG